MIGITLRQLKSDIEPSRIVVQSLEGDIYISYSVEQETLRPIVNNAGERLRARSINQMHDMLRDVPLVDAHLLMQSPYDEMIGLQGNNGVAGVPLAW